MTKKHAPTVGLGERRYWARTHTGSARPCYRCGHMVLWRASRRQLLNRDGTFHMCRTTVDFSHPPAKLPDVPVDSPCKFCEIVYPEYDLVGGVCLKCRTLIHRHSGDQGNGPHKNNRGTGNSVRAKEPKKRVTVTI